jgi:hypothetical protein
VSQGPLSGTYPEHPPDSRGVSRLLFAAASRDVHICAPAQRRARTRAAAPHREQHQPPDANRPPTTDCATCSSRPTLPDRHRPTALPRLQPAPANLTPLDRATTNRAATSLSPRPTQTSCACRRGIQPEQPSHGFEPRGMGEGKHDHPHRLDHRADLNRLWIITFEHYATSPLDATVRSAEPTVGAPNPMRRAPAWPRVPRRRTGSDGLCD